MLLVLMLFASFAEILSIGAVLPFLAVLTSPEIAFNHPAAQPIIEFLEINSPENLLLPFTIVFGVAALFAGGMRLLLLWANTRLSFAIGADFSIDIYRRTLYQPYLVHCSRNSSEVINGIATKANGVIYSIIVPMLTMISSSVMMLAILIALLAVQPLIAVVAFGGFGIIYAVIIKLTRKQLLSDSERIATESSRVIKSLQEGLGGIRDVLLDGSQSTFCEIYRSADIPMRRSQGNSMFIAGSPRFGMEALGMILIAVLAFLLALQPSGINSAIPVLGVLALGAQRLLPVLQQTYGAWSAIRGGQASLEDTLEFLDQPMPKSITKKAIEPLTFKRDISIEHLSFRYSPETPWIMKDLSLVVEKGSRLGIIGITGSGKSTLLDIIMGLLPPTEGALKVDGSVVKFDSNRSWQEHVAHVPQSIFLADATVRENIAFGVPAENIDENRVIEAARQAQIASSIETWPDKYRTLVGERGVRLSGGQRQRIGIARALYKRADVIIFDEATSSLDNDTEQAVMQAIENLSAELTVLIIAHRLTTLKNCTRIVELGEGKIQRIGTYQEIVNKWAEPSMSSKGTSSHAD